MAARELLRRQREETAVLGIVDGVQLTRGDAVRFPHERGATQNPAIRDDLERTDLEPLVAAAEAKREPADEALDFGRVVRARHSDRDGCAQR